MDAPKYKFGDPIRCLEHTSIMRGSSDFYMRRGRVIGNHMGEVLDVLFEPNDERGLVWPSEVRPVDVIETLAELS